MSVWPHPMSRSGRQRCCAATAAAEAGRQGKAAESPESDGLVSQAVPQGGPGRWWRRAEAFRLAAASLQKAQIEKGLFL